MTSSDHAPFADELTLEPVELPTRVAAANRLCLTILAHPQPSRIGERCLLDDPDGRWRMQVSRLEPEFVAPFGGQPRPLGDRFLSRSGFVLCPAARGDALVLDPAGRQIAVDGADVFSEVLIARERCERGVLLRLSARIALLLHEAPEHLLPGFGAFIGCSSAANEVRRQIASAAARDVPALILGETGTGKDLVAEQVHRGSRRAALPFVAVNMAALTPSTAAAELFGYRRGAFTGAEDGHAGIFERSHRGTLLLDELGDTPESIQPMLLRVLETGRVLPLGESRERPVDVRVLAATERFSSLTGALAGLRSSIVHRIAGSVIEVPPLRRRVDDIPRLLLHLLVRHDPEGNWLDGDPADPQPRIGADLVLALVRAPFLGNVRELRNLVLTLIAESRPRRPLAVPSRWVESWRSTASMGEHETSTTRPVREPARMDDDDLARTLAAHGWSPSRAAQALGVPNSTVHYWMRRSRRVRRATDLDDAEIADAHERVGGNIDAMAGDLSVSARALRIRLARRMS